MLLGIFSLSFVSFPLILYPASLLSLPLAEAPLTWMSSEKRNQFPNSEHLRGPRYYSWCPSGEVCSVLFWHSQPVARSWGQWIWADLLPDSCVWQTAGKSRAQGSQTWSQRRSRCTSGCIEMVLFRSHVHVPTWKEISRVLLRVRERQL